MFTNNVDIGPIVVNNWVVCCSFWIKFQNFLINADNADDIDDYNRVIGIALLKAFSCTKNQDTEKTDASTTSKQENRPPPLFVQDTKTGNSNGQEKGYWFDLKTKLKWQALTSPIAASQKVVSC